MPDHKPASDERKKLMSWEAVKEGEQQI